MYMEEWPGWVEWAGVGGRGWGSFQLKYGQTMGK